MACAVVVDCTCLKAPLAASLNASSFESTLCAAPSVMNLKHSHLHTSDPRCIAHSRSEPTHGMPDERSFFTGLLEALLNGGDEIAWNVVSNGAIFKLKTFLDLVGAFGERLKATYNLNSAARDIQDKNATDTCDFSRDCKCLMPTLTFPY
jgi:hypothetical protein